MPILTYPDYKAKNLLTDPTGLIAAWFLDDPAGQSYSRVINPGANASSYIVPRNIAVSGTFGSSSGWSLGSKWTIAGGVLHADGTGVGADALMSPSPVTVGKVYTITFTILNYTSGSVQAYLGSGNIHTFSANGTYTTTGLVTTNTNMGFTSVSFIGDIDNYSITQVNIPAYNSVPMQLLVDGNMETAGVSAWTAGNSATLSKQTGTPHSGTQVLRVARNGSNNPSARQLGFLTAGSVYRVSGYCRSDGNSGIQVQSNGTQLFAGTTSTTWQAFDFIFVSVGTDISLLAITATGTQYAEFDDVVVALDTGIRRDQVLQDNDMEASGIGNWTIINSAIVTKQTGTPHSGTQCLRIARNGVSTAQIQQQILVRGKSYRITGWVRSDGTATGTIQVGVSGGVSSTTSTSWQYLEMTGIATNTAIVLFINTSVDAYAEFDDITLYEIDPLSGTPANGVSLGVTTGANGHLNTCYSFDGSNDVVNVYSTDLNSMFNPSEGTLVAWAKVSGSGVWTDATTRVFVEILADANNFIELRKSTTNNQIRFFIKFGGVSITINDISLGGTTLWFQTVITWSKSNDQIKAHINGRQTSTIQTGLGTWSGNLSSTGVALGASTSGGATPFSGFINDVRLYNRALSPIEIYNLYKGAWPFYMNK